VWSEENGTRQCAGEVDDQLLHNPLESEEYSSFFLSFHSFKLFEKSCELNLLGFCVKQEPVA